MKYSLRPYQQEAVDSVYKALRERDDNPCVVLPTGTGKSLVLGTIASDAVTKWGGRVLILAHVKELLEQNAAKIRSLCPEIKVGVYSAGLKSRDTTEQVIVAGIQSVYNKADKLDRFDLIIIDECFPEGTLIDTPRGQTKIEDLYVGQPVYHALGVGKIEAISSRPTNELIELELNNGTTIRCTRNHPFFTNHGWVKAESLEMGTCLYSREDVSRMRERISSENILFKEQQAYSLSGRRKMEKTNDLFKQMLKLFTIPKQKHLEKNSKKDKKELSMLRSCNDSSILQRQADCEKDLGKEKILLDILRKENGKSNVQELYKGEVVSKTKANWPQAEDKRRQWTRDDVPAEYVDVDSGRHCREGICSNDNKCTEDDGRAALLQTGRCDTKQKTRDSIGRIIALCEENKNNGQEREDVSCGIRVVGITHIKLESNCVVYNLQVEGHPSYFANGVLVHNCHLIPPDGDGMYRTFLEDEKKINPHVRIIGLTATPYRLKGGLICKPENILNFVCYEAGLREMIAEGYLSPIVPKGGSMDTNFDGLHIRNGEFIPEEVDELMGKERTVQNACAEVVALTKKRKAVLIFGCSVKHCQKIKKHIEEQSGEECAIVTGETPSDERAEILERIKGHSVKTGLFGEEKKPLKYLVNCAVLTTGFDAPNIDCVVMMRPTASPGLLVQCAGRGLRLSPDTGKKDVLFLDYGGNIVRHGPLDAIRVKEGGHRKRDDEQPPAKKCPKCQALVPTMRMVCPDCGYEWPAREATHEESASTVGVITGQITTAEYDVLDINYQKWLKRGDDAAPPTVCIEYIVADNLYKREWICPEHNGYARRKFEKWWEEHRIDETVEFPETADEAVAMARNGLLKNVKRITVRQVTGERFDRITGYVFDEAKTERQLEFEDTSWVGDAPTGDIGEEIPF